MVMYFITALFACVYMSRLLRGMARARVRTIRSPTLVRAACHDHYSAYLHIVKYI